MLRLVASNDNAQNAQNAQNALADHVDRANVTTAADLRQWLNELADTVDLAATYLITGKPFEHVRAASLTRLTLTDGSEVFDIHLT